MPCPRPDEPPRLSQPAASGMTMKTSTEVMSIVAGDMHARDADKEHHHRSEGEHHDEVVDGDLGERIRTGSPSVR